MINKSFSKTTFYHGSTSCNIDKFLDNTTNWFTSSEEYAREYFEYNGKGCLYKCNLDLGKVCDIGKTGVPVFAGSKIFSYVENQLNQIGCTHDEIIKLIDDTIEEGWVDSKYQLKLSTIIRSEIFRKMMLEKGYDSVKTLEYSKTLGNYVECYGVFNNQDIKIIDKELIESLQEKIVRKGNQYQVQSEKGRNMGTYKTKKEAEKRLNQIEYFKHIDETIEKQDDVEYQGYTIVHFPLTWTFGDKSGDMDGWIIESPYYLETKGQRHYLPLYPEDESGNELNFETIEEAKNYIDKYLVTDKVKLVIKHRDEVHAEVKDEFRNDLGESLNEKAEKHNTLNPKLFDKNNQLKSEVHDKILEIVDEFKKGLEEDGVKINIKDIIIVGSNASYNYNDQSDVDVHIRVDTKSLDCPDNLYPLLYSAYRSIFNKKFDIDFYGIPVELYVETIDEEPGVVDNINL